MKVKCPSCQTVFTAPASAPGTFVSCRCGKSLRMPGSAGAQSRAEASSSANSANSGGGDSESLFGGDLSSLLDDDIEVEDAAPRTPAPAKLPARLPSSLPPPMPAKAAWQFEPNVVFRTGITLLLVGIASFILPAFGLQIRRLNRLGPKAPLVGGILGFVGAGLLFVSHASQ